MSASQQGFPVASHLLWSFNSFRSTRPLQGLQPLHTASVRLSCGSCRKGEHANHLARTRLKRNWVEVGPVSSTYCGHVSQIQANSWPLASAGEAARESSLLPVSGENSAPLPFFGTGFLKAVNSASVWPSTCVAMQQQFGLVMAPRGASLHTSAKSQPLLAHVGS